MPFQKDQLDPDDLETVTMHKILETTSIFQRAVYLVGAEFSCDFREKQALEKLIQKFLNVFYTRQLNLHHFLVCFFVVVGFLLFVFFFKLSKANIHVK